MKGDGGLDFLAQLLEELKSGKYKITFTKTTMEESKGMSLNEYQRLAMTTCMGSCDNDAYMLLGLVGEVGELMGKIAKGIRKTKVAFAANDLVDVNIKINGKTISCGFTEEELHDIKSEVGDCAWFIAGICKVMGWTLEEVCQENLDKLASRKERGVIDGSGDRR